MSCPNSGGAPIYLFFAITSSQRVSDTKLISLSTLIPPPSAALFCNTPREDTAPREALRETKIENIDPKIT